MENKIKKESLVLPNKQGLIMYNIDGVLKPLFFVNAEYNVSSGTVIWNFRGREDDRNYVLTEEDLPNMFASEDDYKEGKCCSRVYATLTRNYINFFLQEDQDGVYGIFAYIFRDNKAETISLTPSAIKFKKDGIIELVGCQEDVECYGSVQDAVAMNDYRVEEEDGKVVVRRSPTRAMMLTPEQKEIANKAMKMMKDAKIAIVYDRDITNDVVLVNDAVTISYDEDAELTCRDVYWNILHSVNRTDMIPIMDYNSCDDSYYGITFDE